MTRAEKITKARAALQGVETMCGVLLAINAELSDEFLTSRSAALVGQIYRNLGALEMEIAIQADRLAGGSQLVRQLLLSTPQADRSCSPGDFLPGPGRVGSQKQSAPAAPRALQGGSVRRSSPASTKSAPSAE